MELNTAIHQYLNNIESSFMVQEKLFSKNLSSSDVKEYGDSLKAYFSENNCLLDFIFYDYKQHPELMNEDIYAMLFEFAKTLFEKYQRREVELCFEIHLFLLDYVNKTGDKNLILKERYYTGLMDYYVRIMEIDLDDHHFFDCIDMKDDYLGLTKQGREMFCKCLGNTLIAYQANESDEIIAFIDKGLRIIDFFNREDVRTLDPDFNFDYWVIATRKNITKVLVPLREGTIIPDKYLAILCETARINYEESLANNPNLDSDLVLDFQYIYHVALFHANQITIDQLLDVLKRLAFTKTGSSYVNYEIFAYYLDYMVYFSTLPEHEIQAKAVGYFKEYSKQADDLNMDTYNTDYALVVFISNVLRYIKFEEVKDVLFEIMIKRHLPTYIHTMMVAQIADTIIKQILTEKPDLLIGFKNYQSVEEVLVNRLVIIDCMQDVARFHDIGKYYCMDNVSNTYRRLTIRERNAIKRHPVLGYEMLSLSDADVEIKRGVLLHHVYYNHQGGYPRLDKMEDFNHTLLDILTIADSIDAATDRIGRVYSPHKTYDEIILDLYDQADARYSKAILDVLVKMQNHQDIESSRIALYLSLHK